MTSAAICAVGIAVNPLGWTPSWWPLPHKYTPHGIFAVLFFAMIMLSCWLCRGDSLKLNKLSSRNANYYRDRYKLISAFLVIAPVTAVLLNFGFFPLLKSQVFFAEAAAIWTFAWYWFTKSGELQEALEAAKRQNVAAKKRSQGLDPLS